MSCAGERPDEAHAEGATTPASTQRAVVCRPFVRVASPVAAQCGVLDVLCPPATQCAPGRRPPGQVRRPLRRGPAARGTWMGRRRHARRWRAHRRRRGQGRHLRQVDSRARPGTPVSRAIVIDIRRMSIRSLAPPRKVCAGWSRCGLCRDMRGRTSPAGTAGVSAACVATQHETTSRAHAKELRPSCPRCNVYLLPHLQQREGAR